MKRDKKVLRMYTCNKTYYHRVSRRSKISEVRN